MNDEVRRNFEKRFKVTVFEGYGLTETTSFSCINCYPKTKRVIGSIGKELPVNDMAIFNPNNFTKMKNGMEGEICIRGYNVAKYYHNLKNKIRNPFLKDGLEVGIMEKLIIMVIFIFWAKRFYDYKGGENIYPREIENALYKIKDVEECAVIGIPDKYLGQNICAFIKSKNNKVSSDFFYAKLKNYLGSFKLPKEIYIISKLKKIKEIPKGPLKKDFIRKLRDYYEKNLRN